MQTNAASGSYDASATVEGELAVALRGMAVEEEYGSVPGFRPMGAQMSTFNGQTNPATAGRGVAAGQPSRAPFNGFPQPDFSGYYQGHSARMDFPFPYDAYGRANADPSLYAASPALSAATAASTYSGIGPAAMHPHMLTDVHGQQSNMFYDYANSGRQGAGYYYATQPVMYHSHPPLHNISTHSTHADKKQVSGDFHPCFFDLQSNTVYFFPAESTATAAKHDVR